MVKVLCKVIKVTVIPSIKFSDKILGTVEKSLKARVENESSGPQNSFKLFWYIFKYKKCFEYRREST